MPTCEIYVQRNPLRAIRYYDLFRADDAIGPGGALAATTTTTTTLAPVSPPIPPVSPPPPIPPVSPPPLVPPP